MFYLLACNRDIQEALIRLVRALDDFIQVMFQTSNIIKAKRTSAMLLFVVVVLLLCFFLFFRCFHFCFFDFCFLLFGGF